MEGRAVAMYDYAIVGGGIVGLSVGMALTERCPGARIVVIEKEAAWATLKDEDTPTNLGSMVRHLMLRAQANPQRHYEIYTITAVDGITDEDIRGMFDNDPQGSADLIRDRGHRMYSDRVDKKTVKIV